MSQICHVRSCPFLHWTFLVTESIGLEKRTHPRPIPHRCCLDDHSSDLRNQVQARRHVPARLILQRLEFPHRSDLRIRRRTLLLRGKQLLRSATSIGAHYRAACRAKSTADFIKKLAIVEEEADESIYWLELLVESGQIKANWWRVFYPSLTRSCR